MPKWLKVAVVVFLVVDAVALGVVGVRYCLERSSLVPEVRVVDLLEHRGRYEGREVSLTLRYGQRSPEDPVAELISRSDCYLHDASGSVLLFGGWQVWNRWHQEGSWKSSWLEVDPSGVWHVKRATVRYDGRGLPYLELPETD